MLCTKMNLKVYVRNLDCISAQLRVFFAGGRVDVRCLIAYVMLLALHFQEVYHNIPRLMTMHATLACGGYFK